MMLCRTVIQCHHHRLSDVQKTMISLLYELINLRDSYLVFSGDFNFNQSDFLALIYYMSTVWVYELPSVL